MAKARCTRRVWLLAMLIPFQAFATNYFIHPVDGSDSFPGTSKAKPWQTLARASSAKLRAGDKVLLATGSVFEGSLILSGITGRKNAPVTVSSYDLVESEQGVPAKIDAGGRLAGIHILNSSYLEIDNLEIVADAGGVVESHVSQVNDMRVGVLVEVTKRGDFRGIHLKRLKISNIFFEEHGFKRPSGEVKTANGTQRYGWGVRFINDMKSARLRDISIKNSMVENVSHTGIKLTSKHSRIESVQIHDNQVSTTGGPGIQMSGVSGVHAARNRVDRSGSSDDSRKWGRGSGLWTWGSSNVLIEHNHFTNASGPADSAGVHIDFNCKDVVVQYNFSANNAGGFCEILGNNFNNAYRYNISLNDGYRVKGRDDAFQEGKTIWLSGYRGKKKERLGPFNTYIYNNTIVVDESIDPKFAIDKTANGILIANNIFYIKGNGKHVAGDQYRPERQDGTLPSNTVFTNNLYLHSNSWPGGSMIQDQAPIFGEPEFLTGEFREIADFTPTNAGLIKDRGITINHLSGDPAGLRMGLSISNDVLGNPITGQPDLGAIEWSIRASDITPEPKHDR